MASLTKTVDGKALPADKFAMVLDSSDPSTWHLPIDDDHVGSAVKMFGHETHGSAEQKKAAAHKIASAAKAKGIDTKDFESKYCHAERNDGWIEIFRAGEYPGKAPVTRADLERVVRNYDPGKHEAPVVVGHPKTDGPAFAWVERLALDGDTLLMKEKQVDPEFNKLREAGRYKKRSTAFYPDESGRAMALRHVGYLGAEPPAVKGLKDVSFDDAGRQYIEVEFGEEESVAAGEANEKQIGEGVAAWFKKNMPFLFSEGGAQPRSFSEEQVKQIAADAATAAAKPLQDKVTALETKLSDQATQFSERERKLVTGETEQRAQAAIAKLKSSGRWVPAFEKSGLVLLFAELAKSDATLEFGEGDQKKKQTGLEILTTFMEQLPKIVPDGRLVTGEGHKAGAAGSLNFTEGKGVKVDQNSIALDAEVKKLMKANSKLSYAEAMGRVVEERPELTLPGGSQAGAV